MEGTKQASVLRMSGTPGFRPDQIEIIDSAELAKRLGIPESWIRAHVTARYPAEKRIPCVRLGRYVRFAWGSPQLTQWLQSMETR